MISFVEYLGNKGVKLIVGNQVSFGILLGYLRLITIFTINFFKAGDNYG